MPKMADVVVKNDVAADVTLVAKTAAPGDGQSAIWRIDAYGTAPHLKPEIRMHSSGSPEKRKIRVTSRFPYWETANGVTSLKSVMAFSTEVDVPQSIPDTVVKTYCHVYANAVASALFKECFATQFAPTA